MLLSYYNLFTSLTTYVHSRCLWHEVHISNISLYQITISFSLTCRRCRQAMRWWTPPTRIWTPSTTRRPSPPRGAGSAGAGAHGGRGGSPTRSGTCCRTKRQRTCDRLSCSPAPSSLFFLRLRALKSSFSLLQVDHVISSLSSMATFYSCDTYNILLNN